MSRVESAEDRAAFLDDFGIGVRLFAPSGETDILGLYDAPTREGSGIADAVDFLEPMPTILVRSDELGGLRVNDRLELLEGSAFGEYRARSIVAEDDGAFTRIELAEA